MKTANQIIPSYAPIYAAALYPDLAKIFVNYGYALAVHGSLQRDFNLIAVPWIKFPAYPEHIIEQITSIFWIRVIGEPEEKEHGRIVYTISVGHSECAIDLSFMPIVYE